MEDETRNNLREKRKNISELPCKTKSSLVQCPKHKQQVLVRYNIFEIKVKRLKRCLLKDFKHQFLETSIIHT